MKLTLTLAAAAAAAALLALPAAAHEQAGPHIHPHGSEAGPLAFLVLAALGAAAWWRSRR